MIDHTRKIRRILIANRGEIARRIIRTCRILDIETVAVYSDVDAHAPHVREADFSEPLGDPMAYLSIEAILNATQRSNADAVHPGYGFLSENPALPEALSRRNITFIGPNADTIRALGSKTNAKAIAKRANVPVAPTLLLSETSQNLHLEQLTQFTKDVGLPVIIKAAAGGGGRGMRLITHHEDCAEALASAARESHKAFGSSEIFVEKYIAPARHVEVQIAGDMHGNVISLGTRDCSLQRNNQKIIEEAPALGLKPGVSDEMCLAACRLAKEIGYQNLGTVEFLYTEDGLFYFLEVNTRLQVEHPVTELVTGLDLVKLQLDLAAGMTLGKALETDTPPIPFGHAIEARLCAEEYTGQFITTTGILLDAHIPRGPRNSGLIRVDLGYEVCSEVSHHYDSLLGKVIAHAPTRAEAQQILREALSEIRLVGVGTNRSLLIHLLSTRSFSDLKHTVQGTQELLPAPEQLHEEWFVAHAIASLARIFTARDDWAHTSPWCDRDKVVASNVRYPLSTSIHGVTITSTSLINEEGVTVQITGPESRELLLQCSSMRQLNSITKEYVVSLNRASPVKVSVAYDGATTWIHTPQSSCCLHTLHSRTRTIAGASDSTECVITSPIPGKVTAIHVAPGETVQEGDILVVLDSMKMEHPFRAPRAGTVAAISVTQGVVVHAGAVLVTLA